MNLGVKYMQYKSDEKASFIQSTFVGGTIWKKSRYINNWEKRYTIITPQGIFTYKNPNKPFTYSIISQTITGLWTRFEFYQGNLIIKIRHGASEKTQFAIPLMKYQQNTRYNWLYQFYRAMMQSVIKANSKIVNAQKIEVKVNSQQTQTVAVKIIKQQVLLQQSQPKLIIVKKQEIIVKTQTKVETIDLLDF